MRYTDKQGNNLNLNDAMAADSFLMVADVYVREPLEMYFNAAGELRAGKRPKGVAAIPTDR